MIIQHHKTIQLIITNRLSVECKLYLNNFLLKRISGYIISVLDNRTTSKVRIINWSFSNLKIKIIAVDSQQLNSWNLLDLVLWKLLISNKRSSFESNIVWWSKGFRDYKWANLSSFSIFQNEKIIQLSIFFFKISDQSGKLKINAF